MIICNKLCIAFSFLIVFTLGAPSHAGHKKDHHPEALFKTFPEINAGIDLFVSTFITSLAPEIETAEIIFDKEKTQLHKGLLTVHIKAQSSITEIENFAKPIDIESTLQLNIKPTSSSKKKLVISLQGQGVFNTTENFIELFSVSFKKKCLEKSYWVSKKVKKNLQRKVRLSTSEFCNIFDDFNFSNGSPKTISYQMLKLWKEKMLDLIEFHKNDFQQDLAEKIFSTVDQGFIIEERGKTVLLNLQIQNFNKTLEKDLPEEYKKTIFNRMNIQNFQLLIDDEKVVFEFHVEKTNGRKMITEGLSLLQAKEKQFFTPRNAKNLGYALRKFISPKTSDKIIGVAVGAWTALGLFVSGDSEESDSGLGLSDDELGAGE